MNHELSDIAKTAARSLMQITHHWRLSIIIHMLQARQMYAEGGQQPAKLLQQIDQLRNVANLPRLVLDGKIENDLSPYWRCEFPWTDVSVHNHHDFVYELIQWIKGPKLLYVVSDTAKELKDPQTGTSAVAAPAISFMLRTMIPVQSSHQDFPRWVWDTFLVTVFSTCIKVRILARNPQSTSWLRIHEKEYQNFMSLEPNEQNISLIRRKLHAVRQESAGWVPGMVFTIPGTWNSESGCLETCGKMRCSGNAFWGEGTGRTAQEFTLLGTLLTLTSSLLGVTCGGKEIGCHQILSEDVQSEAFKLDNLTLPEKLIVMSSSA